MRIFKTHMERPRYIARSETEKQMQEKRGKGASGSPVVNMPVEARKLLDAIDTAWLVEFVDVVRLGSFSRAAKRRKRETSTVSNHIESLERWFGGQLIEPSARPVRLTSFGETVYTTILHVLDQLARQREAFVSDPKHTITVTALQSILIHLFGPWYQRLRDMVPNLYVAMLPGNLHDCLEWIVSGQADFMLCYENDEVPIFIDKEYFTDVIIAHDELIPICGIDHHNEICNHLFHRKSKIKLPFFSYAEGTYLQRIVANIRQYNPIVGNDALDIFATSTIADALKGMVRTNYGIAWVPRSSILYDSSVKEISGAGKSANSLSTTLPIRLFTSVSRQSRLHTQVLAAATTIGSLPLTPSS